MAKRELWENGEEETKGRGHEKETIVLYNGEEGTIRRGSEKETIREW